MNQYLRRIVQLHDGVRKQYQVRPLTLEDVYDAVQVLFYYADANMAIEEFINICTRAALTANDVGVRCMQEEE